MYRYKYPPGPGDWFWWDWSRHLVPGAILTDKNTDRYKRFLQIFTDTNIFTGIDICTDMNRNTQHSQIQTYEQICTLNSSIHRCKHTNRHLHIDRYGWIFTDINIWTHTHTHGQIWTDINDIHR